MVEKGRFGKLKFPIDRVTVMVYGLLLIRWEPKEYFCGIMHDSIEEAMLHAEQSLGFRDARGNFVVDLKPLPGSTRFSGGTVICWKVGTNKRFRVDFEEHYEEKNADLLWSRWSSKYGRPVASELVFASATSTTETSTASIPTTRSA